MPTPDDADKERGLYEKWQAQRADGSSAPGGKHHFCDIFVLDLDHDPLAVPALMAYTEAARAAGYGDLAYELELKLVRIASPEQRDAILARHGDGEEASRE